MEAKYTKAQKALIIKYLKAKKLEEINNLKRQSDKACNDIENSINRRINRVSVTLWNVKIKDILEVERNVNPTVKTLLSEVKAIQEKNLRTKKVKY